MKKPVNFLKTVSVCGGALLMSCVVAVPAQAQLSNVKINEIYGAGGNAGATLNRDYVELYNTGLAAVDLSGSSLQYASTTGNFTNVAPLSGTIQPGRYFLIALSSGANGAPLPAADLTPTGTASLSLAATAGKLALVSNTTPLNTNKTVALAAANGAVDFVSFGPTAEPGEGGTRTPAPSTTTSVERNTPGADSDNNNLDFAVRNPPDPDNSSVGASGPEVSFSVATVTTSEGAGILTLTVTRTSGTGASTVDFAATGGTATAGTDFTLANGTLNFADGELSKTIPVTIADDSVIEGNETFTVTLSNPSAGSALGSVPTATVTIRENDRAAGAILINEIKNDAPGNDGPQEYIELRGTPGAALTNVALVYVPGDSAFASTSLGTARQVVDLTGASFGSNGLLVIKSPTSGPILPAETTVVTDTGFDATGATGAFLNGTGTFLLVFTPSAPIVETTDYDTDNNGTFEAGTALALAERLDSVGFLDGNDGDILYSPAVLRLGSGSTGGSDVTANNSPEAENAVPDAATRLLADNTPDSAAAFFFGELTGADNTTLDYDESAPGTTVSTNFPAGYNLTPGAANTLPVVTPSGPLGYAISGTSLYSFNTSSPGTPTLVGDTTLPFAGIDFNPATGQLFGLVIGSNAQLYTISTSSGAATAVGSGFPLSGTGNSANNMPTGANSYNLGEAGIGIGFDFNPATQQNDGSIRIRVTATNGSDLRLNAATGGVAAVDPLLNGSAASVAGSAYTNNIANTGGATTLYNIADATDQLTIQAPANDGTQVNVGPLGIDAKSISGFDIFTAAGGASNTGFLATEATNTAPSEFYTVALGAAGSGNGAATLVGDFGTLAVSAIAIQTVADTTAPSVTSITRAATSPNPANGTSVAFTVTFSEPVRNVDAADFTVSTTGSVANATIASVVPATPTTSTINRVYTVTVNGFSGSGTLGLNLIDDDSIVDVASTPLGGAGMGNGAFTTGETFTIAPSASSGALISEFRFRGTTSTDEYVEVVNTTNSALNISGWKLQINTAPGSGTANIVTTTVPQNTIIPARGHFLFTGAGYSLGAYSNFGSTGAAGTPTAGNPNPAQPVVAFGGDAADDSGAALLNADNAVQDAVGFGSSAPSLREAGALAAAPTSDGTASSQHAFLRDFSGQFAKDTGNSTSDFVLVSTDGAPVTSGATTIAAQLGAPNPESLSSPTLANTLISVRLLDLSQNQNSAPNRVRTGTGNAGNLLIRRTLRNNSTQAISRLRMQVTRITGQNSPFITAGQADVRLIGQPTETGVPIGTGASATTVTVFGTALEAPSNTTTTTGTAPNTVVSSGGGLGSSLSFDLVLATPLQPNDEKSYAFNLQVAQSGNFVVVFNILANTQAPNPN